MAGVDSHRPHNWSLGSITGTLAVEFAQYMTDKRVLFVTAACPLKVEVKDG